MITQNAIAAFLAAKEARGLSPQTIANYRSRLSIFQQYHRSLPMSPEPIEAILARVGPTTATKHVYFRILRAFYRWLHRRHHIDTNPMEVIDPPLVPRKVARSLTQDELCQLLHFPHRVTVHAFLWLLADTGLRLSEGLGVSKADFGRDMLTVTGKVGQRQVPVSPFVRDIVLALPGEKPFSERWAQWQHASRAVRRGFRRAGFSGKRASAHTLRHTFVRLWEGDESLLVGIMGWTSPQMLKVYRPYDAQRALVQHRRYSPTKSLLMGNGQRQLTLL